MSLKIRLISNKLGSKSLTALAEGLSTKLGYKVFRSKAPRKFRSNILYGDCKDKIFQYKWFKENLIPSLEFTTNAEEAFQWNDTEKLTVIGRMLTRSSEGKGIIIHEPNLLGNFTMNCPVYTKYKKKKKEFRVHVYQDQIVSVLEKRKRKGFEGTVDTKIRNTANGYVFCSQDVVEPEGIRELALKASKVTSSMFKGVDIGFNEKLNELFVIEVNSAPGIQGSNVQRYIEAITA